MKEKNPDYQNSRWSYKNRIATRCRICGGQLILPEESKAEMHFKCKNEIKDNTYMM
tara:strand:+ start:858 stop:1025 length:168 start_codon:yes stop_codon:yes gene_type:complete